MSKELELWRFIVSHLQKSEAVMLLAVVESSGSSPGRAGYKMAVAADGKLFGSIGGGLMEVRLVEQARSRLSIPPAVAGEAFSAIIEQVHQKNSSTPSGMICSGKQLVIFRLLTSDDIQPVQTIVKLLKETATAFINISANKFGVVHKAGIQNVGFQFEKTGDTEFSYIEKLGPKNDLYIIGGGHCALALSELMSKMDFHISIFDDRPLLNTIEKNQFADEITIIDNYEKISELITSDSNAYVVVMTLGYKSDETVIRSLFERDFKYFGVLGSRAKMKTLLTTLEKEGFSNERLARIRTPIGLSINSRTPEEIAVSIAAEIISIKNSN